MLGIFLGFITHQHQLTKANPPSIVGIEKVTGGGIHGRPTVGRRGLWPGTCQQVPALPVSPLRHEAPRDPRDPRGQGVESHHPRDPKNEEIQKYTTVGFGENAVFRGRRLGLEVCTLDLTCRRHTKGKAPQKRDQSENN